MPDEPKKDDKVDDSPDRPTRHKRDRKEVSDVVDRLVGKYGNERAALAVLADESIDYRETLRELKAKAPGEGAVVLSADDAKQWEAFRALGKPAKDIATALTERDTLAAENVEHRATVTATKAAKAIGSDKPTVLAKILKAEGYRLEVKEEKDGDEVKEVAYAVTGEGDAAEHTELAALLTTTLADYRNVLLTEQPQKSATGPQYPPQALRGTAPAPKDKTFEQLKQEKAATGAYFA